MVRPLLGDIELQQVQKIETEAEQTFTQHSIPALEGDFFQGLGRRNTWVKLSGVLTGAEVKTGLKDLRDKFREAQPVDFIADIATATQVNQVVIEEMGVRELAGKPARFEYAFTLREYIPAPVPPQEPPPPIPPRLDPVTATLIVEVIVEGEPTFDFSKVTVTVQGTQDEDSTTLDRTLTNRADNIWTEADFPPGSYTARAIVSSEPELPPGSATAVIQSGQTTQVTITLRRDPQRPTNVAKKFVVHFWFDKAFVEPCMRHVLRQVADYASHHADEKMLIVGNTDESGRDNYNLSLGDRRARSVYAYLTSGRDQPGALAEWNLLRRSQDGQQPTVKDNWNVRQYQYMLQTLGFYPGNVKDTHDGLTTQGVRDFQTSKGLPPTGVVNNATWEKLIEAYLSLDPQAVADAQFFRNCGDEPLKWVSCGEQHPRDDTPLLCSGPAWRPNRRTEILFVRADRLPRPEPIPETFNLPGTPPVGSDWCVGTNTPNANAQRCNFLKQNCSTTPAPDEWCVEPVESGSITVSGSIEDENGNSLGEVKYVLIAPDGKFMDGERQCGTVDRGRPIKGKTALDGTFAYPDQSPIGVYTMEVELPHPPQIAHAKTKPPATGRGSVVCKRLDSGDTVFDVIIRSGTPSQFAVNPLITLTSAIVVVKKSYTNPARQLVTLKTDAEFIGSGTLERSNNAIRFFTAATGNTEITFNGTDNVFDGAQLTAGVPLFAEGATPSTTMDDVQLTLTLSSIDLLVGSPKTATMTAVELTLEIGDRRSAPGVDPVPLSTAAKINPGRFLEVRNPNNTHERALLIVRQANPAVFTGDLELTAIDNKVQIFAEADEVPASGQTALTTPQVIPNGTIPADGVKFWAEGVTASTALRDTGFQLGIKDVEKEGDRVVMTVSSFTLRVEGALRIPGTDTYVATRDPAALITLIAKTTPLPAPVPPNFITWSPNTTATADPMRRTASRTNTGQITATATLTATGETRTVEIFVIQVMLDVDADRDGTVESNAPGKNIWQFGVGRRGAVILCNNDNDDRLAGNTQIDNQNTFVDGTGDVSDLAPLVVRQSGVIPVGASLVLTTSQQAKIRVFDQRTATATALVGPAPLPAEAAIANSQSADLELGMEATQYPDASFDGLIRLALVLKVGSTEVGRDDVVVRVAPWVMTSHLDVTEEVYVVEIPGLNTAPASPFMDGVQAAATAASVPLIRATGANYPYPGSTVADQWMQDTMEVGYSQMPGKHIPVVLDAVRTRGLDPYPTNELLGANYGFFRVSTAVTENTFDSHGNLEVSPPVTVGSKDYKFGRIYHGRGRAFEPFNNRVKEFLDAQLIQKPFEVDTDWLDVGHVDEIISFVPANVGKSFRMLLSSVNDALQILTDLQNAGQGSLKLFTGKTGARIPFPFRQVTINALLGNKTLRAINAACQTRLDAIEAQFRAELGLSAADIIKVPSLFTEDPLTPGVFAALIPGMVNMLVITRPAFAAHQLVIPKPFGPVLTGADQIEEALRSRLLPLGYATSQIRFVDDFESYHIGLGEIHCGTNSKRRPPTLSWWEQVDF